MTVSLGELVLQFELEPDRAELIWVAVSLGVVVLALLLVVAVVLLALRNVRRDREGELFDYAERAARAEAHAEQLRERLAEARQELQRREGRGADPG